MGPLKLIKNLSDNFLIMNGDILTSLNFRNFLTYHKETKIYLQYLLILGQKM